MMKSPNDKAEYKNIILDNKLEAIIVYDKDADISAASMTVNVGYYNDPEDYPGLAHFLEHMLFMGTKKYPDVQHYNEFINNHGGMSNAHTTDEYTSYYFSVQSAHIKEALDIFGQFFIDPLFDKTTVDKEMQAVDSEHSKNTTSDAWRLNRVINKVTNRGHPFSKFSTGNLETLNHGKVRDVLIQFYKEHYTANKMKLCVVSPIKDIDVLIKDIYSKIKTAPDSPRLKYSLPLFDFKKDTSCYKIVKTVPVLDQDSLIILWELPSVHKHFKAKPIEVISFLLGHEGKGSILSYLREKDLATNLFAGSYANDTSMTLNSINIELTQNGFYHIPAIVDTVYEYLQLIKDSSLVDHYNEIKKMAELNFKYKPKSEPMDKALSITENMLFYPAKYCMSLSYVYDNFDKSKDTIREFLNKMTKSRSLIVISSKKYSDICIKKDKYYGVNYLDKTYPDSFGSEFKESILDSKLHLPKKNPYIPDSVELLPKQTSRPPVEIQKGVWYKKDNTYKNPNVVVDICIFSDKISESVENYVKTVLYTNLVNRYLVSDIYSAQLAGSTANISVDYEYIQLSCIGYPGKIDLLLSKLIDTYVDLSNGKLESIFNYVKKEYEKDLMNYIYNKPYILAVEYIKERRHNRYYSYKDQLGALKSIDTVNSLKDMIKQLINSSSVRSFIGGNISEKDALSLSSKLDIFNKSKIESVISVSKGGEYKIKTLNKDEPDSAIVLFYEIGHIKKGHEDWDTKMSMIMLIDKLINRRFFTQLRSIEQSGYIVSAKLHSIGSVMNRLYGIMFVIQSYKKDPDFLDTRIKKFLSDISEFDYFDKYRDTVIQSLKKKDNTMYNKFNRYISEIRSGDCMFNYRERLVKSLKKLTKDDLKQFYKRYFIDSPNTTAVKVFKKMKK